MSPWGRVPLGTLAESVDYGVTASATTNPTGPKFLRITDIQDNAVDWENVPWCECNARALAASQLKSGDIVFARTGATTGKSFLIKECPPEAVFASYLIRVRVRKDVEPRYVSHFFQTTDYWMQITKGARGAAQPGVNATTLKALNIPVAPLPEQRRIATILDQADELRVKRREAFAQLDSLTQSIFIEMFGDPATNPKGWEVNPVANLTLSVTNGMTRRRSERDEGSGIVLRLRDIRSGWIDFSDVNRITLNPSESEKFSVFAGDLLFIRVNGNPDYVGRCAVFNGHSEPVFFNDHIMRVKLDHTRIHSVFLAFLLNSNHGKNEIAKHRKTSAGQHTINQDGLGKIQIPTPPIKLQAEFVFCLESIDRLKNTSSESLAELDTLFASLQHRAFRGEL